MAPPTLPGPDEGRDDAQWRTAGDRIQTLLDGFAAGGEVAQERAEQLVREVTDLYGAALDRIMDIATPADPELAGRFAADGLVASLLLVHGLHPHSTERRVTEALDSVRPYLGSHGGDVSLLSVADGVVRLAFQGNCRSCPSSSVTLELAVQDAIREAAPEISDIELVTAEPASSPAVIPADSLLKRVHTPGPSTAWRAVPEMTELQDAEVGGFRIGGMTALACRIAGDVYAYRDWCAACGRSMVGARLTGSVLHCPGCGAGFDIIHAGVGVGGDSRLEPIPLLERDGVLSAAVSVSAGVA